MDNNNSIKEQYEKVSKKVKKIRKTYISRFPLKEFGLNCFLNLLVCFNWFFDIF